MESAKDKLRAGGAEAALSEARQRLDKGDAHGARKLALSILAQGEKHADTRQLLAALELAAPPAPRASSDAGAPERVRPEVVVLGQPAEGALPLLARVPEPPPLPELSGPLPWAPHEEPPPRRPRRFALRIGLALGVALAAATLLVVRLKAGPGPEAAPIPQTAAPLVAAPPTVPSLVAVATPSAPQASPAPPPWDPRLARTVESFMTAGDYAAALEAVEGALRANPSEPRLRALQRRVQSQARRAVDQTLAGLRAGRAAAEAARAPELARSAYQRGRDREADATKLIRRGLWADALVRRREATAAYQEARVRAGLEQARLAYEAARLQAIEAGAEKHTPDRLAAAVSRAARAFGHWERGEFEAALAEFESAAAALEQARRASTDARRDPIP